MSVMHKVEVLRAACCIAGADGEASEGELRFLKKLADQIGVAVSDVRMVTGDTAHFHWGTGTFASRGAVVAVSLG